jgi:hypothetical protein
MQCTAPLATAVLAKLLIKSNLFTSEVLQARSRPQLSLLQRSKGLSLHWSRNVMWLIKHKKVDFVEYPLGPSYACKTV